MAPRATHLLLLLVATLLQCAPALKRPFATSQPSEEESSAGAATAVRGADESSRPARGSSGVFDQAEESTGPSAEWQAANDGIVADMNAHLKRREKREEADLIGRSPIGKVLDFFGSQYFRNVRTSISLFIGAWVWYVLNTKTYIQPEYEE